MANSSQLSLFQSVVNVSAERIVDVSGAVDLEMDLLFSDGVVGSQKRGLVVGYTLHIHI